MTKDSFESLIASFVGQTVESVRYFDYGISGVEEPWGQPWQGEDPASGRIGVGGELHMSSGDVYWVTYGSEFAHFGVSVQKNPENPAWRREDEWVSVDVSDRACWPSVVGQVISDAAVYWDEFLWADRSRHDPPWEFPQDVGLTTEDGFSLYFSALEIGADGSPMHFADEIRVLCSEKELKEYRVGPYAGPM